MQQNKKLDWVVSIPADTTDNALVAKVRPGHLLHLKSLFEAGIIVFGGPTLREHPKEQSEAPKITGSIIVFRAESAEEVRELVRGNPFAEVGIWNVEAANVQPFLWALKA